MKFIFQHFPLLDDGPKGSILFSFTLGFVVFLFLLIFQPFGLNNFHSPHKSLIISGYGGITFLIVLLNAIVIPKVFPKVFIEKNWKIVYEIGFVIWNFCIIGILNLFYSAFWGFIDISFISFFKYQLIGISVGVFPVGFFLLLKLMRYYKKLHLSNAKLEKKFFEKSQFKTHLNSDSFSIQADNCKTNYTFDSHSLLFITSCDNYIEVYYFCETDNQVNKVLIRTTLKKAYSRVKDISAYFKCHRRFIVNLYKIEFTKGNSQGLHLKLYDCDKWVPVSRTLIKELQDKLKSNKEIT